MSQKCSCADCVDPGERDVGVFDRSPIIKALLATVDYPSRHVTSDAPANSLTMVRWLGARQDKNIHSCAVCG